MISSFFNPFSHHLPDRPGLAPGEARPLAPMALPAGKVQFKASEEWQEVLPHHVLPNGLEVAMA